MITAPICGEVEGPAIAARLADHGEDEVDGDEDHQIFKVHAS